MSRVAALLGRHGRTLLGGAVGAVGGAAYAHFIGCRTGGCAITGNAAVAALFFGFAGLVLAAPGPGRPPGPAGEPGATRAPDQTSP